MFDIALPADARGDFAEGRIIIGDYSESFGAELRIWSSAHYYASWRRSAAMVLEHGAGRFLASVGRPGEASFTTYPCWRVGEAVAVQKSILLASITGDYARPESAEQDVDVFSETGASGAPLKTWLCSLGDLAAFEQRLLHRRVQ